MNIITLDNCSGYDSAGGRTDPGTIEIRPNWMVDSSQTNRVNRKQSGWKNAEHIVLTDPIDDGFVETVWPAIVLRDRTQPCIQKLYVHHGDQSKYSMYDAKGHVADGFLSELLVAGFVGEKVKIAAFAKTGFGLISERNLWNEKDPVYLVSSQSGTDFKTHGIPVLKKKNGDPNETKINGHSRYYEDVVFSILGTDYYLTKEWFNPAYDVVADWFLMHNLTLKEIVGRIRTEGAVMYRGEFGEIQKIFYGAPGTGKSNGVKGTSSKLPKEDVFRTTFHPDSDYSTFVGAYKPKMSELPRVAMDGTTVKKATFDPGITADEKGLLEVEKKISYDFVPQAFTKAYVQAWKKMAKPAADGKVAPVMLVIEEINRGDCAKIFGDLFQLLDRFKTDNPNDPKQRAGFSEYPILADSDLADHVRCELGAVKDAGVFNDYPSVIAAENLELVLPPNLYIWATMNTSDQSLFPMDSAFKRRWDWKYIPIEDKGKKWKIRVGTDEYRWWSFLKCINDKIAEHTSSEDKQLGYFFAQPRDGGTVIDTETFIAKVIFYLWKDVFRDDLPQSEPFKYTFEDKEQEKEREIRFTDFYQADLRDKLVGHFLEKLGVEKVVPEQSAV